MLPTAGAPCERLPRLRPCDEQGCNQPSFCRHKQLSDLQLREGHEGKSSSIVKRSVSTTSLYSGEFEWRASQSLQKRTKQGASSCYHFSIVRPAWQSAVQPGHRKPLPYCISEFCF